MRKLSRRALAGIVAVAGLAAVATAFAGGGKSFQGSLTGFEEVPAVSSTGIGDFAARVVEGGEGIEWRLRYDDLEGSVTQAHIHFGQAAVNGGISVFLCSNLPSPPPGTQACPPPPATISGTAGADDVIGPAGQGIAAGELAELLRAIEAGNAYANVHSTKHPGGEVRGQLRPGSPGK